MGFRDYLRVIKRQWRLILLFLAVTVALAVVLTVRTTPTYSSSVELFVSTADRGTTQAYEGSLFSAQRVTSYARLAQSRELSNSVVQQLGLDIPPDDLSRRITATVVPDTVILDIAVTDTDARRAQQLAQAVAERLTAMVSQLEAPSASTGAPIQANIVDPASLPTTPISPRPLKNLGLAALLGLTLGLGSAVLREMLDSSVRDPEDIPDVAGVPVMGMIGEDSRMRKDPLVTGANASPNRVEAFRVLRTNMQFISVDHESQVFTVTSAVPDEGKTSTATNLAIALAQADHSVLLVDGDLRRPGVDVFLGMDGAVGLTNVLIGRNKLDDAIKDGPVPNLSVLPSGVLPPNPSELLQSHAMKQVLARARESYDTVIIDSPPLLSVTDATLLAVQSDGALLVVRHGKTTKDQLRRAVDRLVAVNAHVVGAVLNMIPRRDGVVRSYNVARGPASRRNVLDPGFEAE